MVKYSIQYQFVLARVWEHLLGLHLFVQKNYEKALRIRKILGGGMRQSGYLAAAAIYGIENNWDKLKEDHRKAKELSKILIKVKGIKDLSS